MRDVHGHLIGYGDRVKHVCGPDMGTVIGTTTIEELRYVRTERGMLHTTYATAPNELEVVAHSAS